MHNKNERLFECVMRCAGIEVGHALFRTTEALSEEIARQPNRTPAAAQMKVLFLSLFCCLRLCVSPPSPPPPPPPLSLSRGRSVCVRACARARARVCRSLLVYPVDFTEN